MPGATGVIDLVGFMQDLQQIGYDGPVVAEPFDRELASLAPEERVLQTAQSLTRVREGAGI